MSPIKQLLLSLISSYNQGRPVGYPAIDRKMLQAYPDLVKSGQLGAVLDELVAENLLEQVGASSYQAVILPSVAADS